MKLFLLLQNQSIEEKAKNAPDSSYEIGLFIGTYLPFVLLIGLAYLLYYTARKRKNSDKN
jgi:hypothetical protein